MLPCGAVIDPGVAKLILRTDCLSSSSTIEAASVKPDPAATRLLFPTLKIRVSCCSQFKYRAIFFVI